MRGSHPAGDGSQDGGGGSFGVGRKMAVFERAVPDKWSGTACISASFVGGKPEARGRDGETGRECNPEACRRTEPSGACEKGKTVLEEKSRLEAFGREMEARRREAAAVYESRKPELEDQIANAIIQAQSKGDDRTSKSGNILIFGAHGSGKTTLAMNLAKAICTGPWQPGRKDGEDFCGRPEQEGYRCDGCKDLRWYADRLKRPGILMMMTVDQLTTAMEFRTDGLILILEDEQKYVHELLMRHPRFTMKFTAQIYIPDYTVEELAMFGQIYANEQDYMIGDEGWDALYEKISALAAVKANDNEPVTIKDVIDMVAKAINHANGFFRKMKMGQKRYDENDYVILFAKDFGK